VAPLFAVFARPDEECIKILKAVRSSVGSNTKAAGRSSSSSRSVKLLIVEITTTEGILPCHLAVRWGRILAGMLGVNPAAARSTQWLHGMIGPAQLH
jgi:hypothetical protein